MRGNLTGSWSSVVAGWAMPFPVCRVLGGAMIALCLAACDGARVEPPAAPAAAAPSPSSGQVGPGSTTPSTTHYAASRLADQASFGPTPGLVARVQQLGIEGWIDEQLAQPVSTARLGISEDWDKPSGDRWYFSRGEIVRMFVAEPDQLRLRVAWALSQVVVTSAPDGMLRWWTLLQTQALGNYRDLLVGATIHPVMGAFLNNSQNRPTSASCPQCAPNENYARELLQLFSIGPIVLGDDGVPRRNAEGEPLESYSQADVEEVSRALTGWTFDPTPASRPSVNYGNWAKPMVASTVPDERDAGAKRVLGRPLPAGQSAPKDLADVVDVLMAHPNIGPFIALRLIQHLVKSDPSPDYVRRVATAFRNNGSGVAGDMKAVVKAVLLDPEARAGDRPQSGRPDDGKIREPMLHRVAVYRGLGCQQPLYEAGGKPGDPPSQTPLGAGTVFSFYAPGDRAPGSNLLSPEQRLLSNFELMWRFRYFKPANDVTAWRAAGCNVEEFARALTSSPRTYSELLNQRFFRGAMPASLRVAVESQIQTLAVTPQTVNTVALGMLGFALGSPQFGAIR